MTTEPLLAIGVVRKTHGYDGELKLALSEQESEAFKAAKFLFIGTEATTAVPFAVAGRRGADDIVSLTGLDSKESAEALRGQSVFIREALADRVPTGKPPPVADEKGAKAFARFIGFGVIDEALGEIGAIAEVDAYPGQALARVRAGRQEHLIPLNAELIKGVDFTKKIVFMELPEGLLDL